MKKTNEKKIKKPLHFLIFKIVGLLLLVGGIVCIIIGVKNKIYGLAGAGGSIGIMFGIYLTVMGFIPEMQIASAKTQKYIQQETKSDLKDISTTNAEIHSEAVTTTVKAVKEGLQDSIYCKHCGERIDSDSKFCKSCGKQQ